MREAGRHLADRTQARHVRNFVLMLAGLLPRELVLGNVLGDARHAINLAGFVAYGERPIADPADRAVRQHHAVLLYGIALRHPGKKTMTDTLAIIGVDRLYPAVGVIVKTLQRASPHARVRGADISPGAVGVGHPEYIANMFGQLPKAFFTLF